jgi:hypothetical protein
VKTIKVLDTMLAAFKKEVYQALLVEFILCCSCHGKSVLFFKLACGVRKTGLQNVFAFLDVGIKTSFYNFEENYGFLLFYYFSNETKISKINFPTNSSLQFRQSKSSFKKNNSK